MSQVLFCIFPKDERKSAFVEIQNRILGKLKSNDFLSGCYAQSFHPDPSVQFLQLLLGICTQPDIYDIKSSHVYKRFVEEKPWLSN